MAPGIFFVVVSCLLVKTVEGAVELGFHENFVRYQLLRVAFHNLFYTNP
jgi:hypothetical protein